LYIDTLAQILHASIGDRLVIFFVDLRADKGSETILHRSVPWDPFGLQDGSLAILFHDDFVTWPNE
jgi:hypothetical protein